MSRKGAQRFCGNDMRKIKKLKRTKRGLEIAMRFRETVVPTRQLRACYALRNRLMTLVNNSFIYDAINFGAESNLVFENAGKENP